MQKKVINFFLLAALCVCLMFLSFKQNAECTKVKSGTFYLYKDNGKSRSRIIRKDSIQTEINLVSMDTTYWYLSWHSDCEFTCSYISGSNKKTTEELEFYKNSTLKFKINDVTDTFYTYTAALTFKNQVREFSDTLWINAK